MNAVDTNVLVYAVDSREPVKQTKARALLRFLVESPVRVQLPWQVAAEYLSCLRRWQSQGRITNDEVQRYLEHGVSIFPLCFSPTVRTLYQAIQLSARHSLSHWDSMLLGACKEAGISTLYSEDLSSGVDYDGVTVINPFR